MEAIDEYLGSEEYDSLVLQLQELCRASQSTAVTDVTLDTGTVLRISSSEGGASVVVEDVTAEAVPPDAP